MGDTVMYLKNYFLVLACMFLTSTTVIGAPSKIKLPGNYSLESLTQGSMNTNQLKGKTVLVQFFASWCVGCDEVMEQISERFSSNKNLVYLPISVDEDLESANSFFENNSKKIKSIQKKSYLDKNGKLAEKLGIEAVPALLIATPAGEIVYSRSGHPTKNQFKKMNELLSRRKVN